MGKGSPQQSAPTQSTAYQTNLPEYARPYVETMLGATQKQLFNTQDTTDASGNTTTDITGFKPYQPYSTNPSDYVAGFSPLQQQAQSTAANMQLPGEYGAAAGLAGIGAMGSMGAGRDYQRMATNPYAMQAYMNPYVQASLQPQLNQLAEQGQIQAQQAAGQATAAGAFGGTRSALQQNLAQRNALMAQQAALGQGYNQAYQQAQQAQQFGANLGLQGYGQALQGAGQLANIGSQALQGQQGIANLQSTLGGQQQAAEQQKINQSIQDYATAQQYPLMQLGFMSNMLRGLPMQSTTTQQYQAQAPIGQQAAGLLGAYGAYKGGFKEGGAVEGLGYANRGVVDSMRDRLETMADTDPKGLTKLLSQTKSQELKDIGAEVLSGIALADSGKLGTNLAGGGIIAFSGEDGSLVELTDEEKKALEDNPYLQRSRAVKEALAPLGQLRNYDPVQKLADLGGGLRRSWDRFINESPEDQAKRFRSYSNRTEQAANPTQNVPAVKTASQRQEDAEAAETLANVGRSKIDYNKADQILKASKNVDSGAPADGSGAGGGGNGGGGKGSPAAPGYGVSPGGMAGIDDAYARVLKLTGQDQTPQEMTDYLNAIKARGAKLGEMQDLAERTSLAKAFLTAGANPRGLLAGAIEGGQSYLTDTVANREKYDKLGLEYSKLQSDYRKGELERARGNFDAAEKLFDKAKDREKDIIVAQMQMNKPGEFEKMYAVYAADEKAAGRTPSFEGFKRSSTFSDETSKLQAVVKADTVLANDMNYLNLANSKKPEDRQRAAQIRQAKVDEYLGYLGGSQQTASNTSGNRLRFDASGKQI